jgi:hypothetical protein
MPPYVPTEPGNLDPIQSGTEALLEAQRRRMDEAALTAEDLRIAKLVHGLVAAEIRPHIKRLEDAIKAVDMSEEERDWVRMAIKREARREAFHDAVIQKTITSLIWAGIVGLGVLIWRGFKQVLGQ